MFYYIDSKTTQQKITEIIKLLKNNFVETLIIEEPLTDHNFFNLCEALKVQTKLLDLEIKYSLPDKYVVLLSEALKKNQSLQIIHSSFKSNTLAVSALLQTINQLPKLQALTLVDANFQNNLDLTQPYSKCSYNLKTLIFHNCRFHPVSGPMITEMLCSNKLETLDLSNNRLGQQFIKDITYFFNDHQYLRNLKLEYCVYLDNKNKADENYHLGNSGALHIAKFLMVNNSLQYLSLSRNAHISIYGLEYILNALEYNTSLNVLEIDNIPLNLSSMKNLMEYEYNTLSKNKNLLSIKTAFLEHDPHYISTRELLRDNYQYAIALAVSVEKQIPLDRKNFFELLQRESAVEYILTQSYFRFEDCPIKTVYTLDQATGLIDNLLQKSILGNELSFLGIKKHQQHNSCAEQDPYSQNFSFLESLPQEVLTKIFSKNILKDYYKTNQYVHNQHAIEDSFVEAIRSNQSFELECILTKMKHPNFDQSLKTDRGLKNSDPFAQIIDTHVKQTHAERIYSEFKNRDSTMKSR